MSPAPLHSQPSSSHASWRPAMTLLPALVLLAAGAVAAAEGEPPALAAREQQLLAQYRDLEKTFLRLADILAASDPRRAAVLRGVFEQARDQEVGGRLDTIVQLLEKGQLLKAGTTQASAIEQLRELLTLLEAGDSDRHLANSKEEVKQFLARVSKLIAKQRDIEGATEAGAGEAKLADRQEALAGETGELSRDLGGFAKRMEVRDAGGERVEQGGKKPAEGDAPEGGGKGEPEETGKESRPGDEGPRQDGAKPTDGAPAGEPSQGEGSKGGEQESGGEAGKSSPGGAESPGEGQPQGGPEEADEKPAGAAPPDGDDESSRAKRTQNRLEAAAERMRKAEEAIEQAKRRDARRDQEKAIEELETARAELEEILRQLREQEVERLLVQLEARLRGMLRAEKTVLAGLEKLAAEPVGGRERELEAARLGRDQAAVGTDAVRALSLVRDDGSAVAIPEALEQVRDDAQQAAARLSRGDAGATTRGVVQDIVTNLEEMVAALEKAQQEQQQRQKGQAGGRPAEPGEQPLVDKLSELKMIRSLQMRVNTRTKRFAQVLGDGIEQAEEPELLDAVRKLSDRQRKIERAAHDIVTGLTE